jgi:hypothetical protein
MNMHLNSPSIINLYPFLTKGTGRTGFIPVPPNNYPFYNDDEKYVPIMQADGGQLSGKTRLSRYLFHPKGQQPLST